MGLFQEPFSCEQNNLEKSSWMRQEHFPINKITVKWGGLGWYLENLMNKTLLMLLELLGSVCTSTITKTKAKKKSNMLFQNNLIPICCSVPKKTNPMWWYLGFPSGSAVKNLPAMQEMQDTGSIPGLERVPWRTPWQPTPVSCLENPMDRGAWQATVHRVPESWTLLKQLRTHTQMKLRGRLYVQSTWKNLLTWLPIPRSMFCKP